MNDAVPFPVNLTFIAVAVITYFLLIRSTTRKKTLSIILIAWLALQTVISLTGFYLVNATVPPRFAILVTPVILTIILLFIIPAGKRFVDSFDTEKLTWLHIVRLPVELTLFWLFIYGQVPEIMTFEGRNFDILSGITAPLIVLLGYRKKILSPNMIIAWNVICLALLFNIVIMAVLSVPTPFQQLAFDQPNVGVLYFPFTLLPALVVPAVLFSHLACIRFQLKKQK